MAVEKDVDVIGKLLRSWNSENQLDVEAKLLVELELEPKVVFHGCLDEDEGDDDNRLLALGRVLQQRAFPGVKTLGVVYCRLRSETSLSEIAKAVASGNLPSLETLNFGSNAKVGDVGAKILGGALKATTFPNLHRFHLIDSGLGNEGLEALADALDSGNLPALSRLHLGSENEVFLNSGVKALARVFASGKIPALEDLSIQGISEVEGLVDLVKSLGAGKVGEFKNLDLSNCKFGLEAAQGLAEALQTPSFASLRLLDLQSNSALNDDALLALCEAIGSSNLVNLRCLGLKKVSIGEVGLVKLASVLEAANLPALQEVFADGAQNTAVSAEALVRAYEKNTSLVALITIDWPDATLQGNADAFKRRNKDRQIARSRKFRGSTDNETSEENQQEDKTADATDVKQKVNELKPWKRGLSFARRDVPVEVRVCS